MGRKRDKGSDVGNIYIHENGNLMALLVIMGMPGERKGGIARLFSLDQLFFKRELGKFTDLPPLLFVKASRKLNLVED